MNLIKLLQCIIMISIPFVVSCSNPVDTENDSELKDGLIAYYPLNGNAKDFSGNRLDGAMYHTENANEKKIPENAIYFNGTNSFIDCGMDPLLELDGDVSISLWAKLDYENTDHWYQYISKRDTCKAAFGLNFNPVRGPEGEILQWYFGDGTELVNCPLSISFPPNELHHIVVTREVDTDSTRMAIYWNGELKSYRSVVEKPVKAEGVPVLIGRKHDNYTGYEYFKGVIYDVRIYNKVITTDVIKKLHKN